MSRCVSYITCKTSRGASNSISIDKEEMIQPSQQKKQRCDTKTNDEVEGEDTAPFNNEYNARSAGRPARSNKPSRSITRPNTIKNAALSA